MMPLHPDLHLELSRQHAHAVRRRAADHLFAAEPLSEGETLARERRLRGLFRHFDSSATGLGKEPAWPCA